MRHRSRRFRRKDRKRKHKDVDYQPEAYGEDHQSAAHWQSRRGKFRAKMKMMREYRRKHGGHRFSKRFSRRWGHGHHHPFGGKRRGWGHRHHGSGQSDHQGKRKNDERDDAPSTGGHIYYA